MSFCLRMDRADSSIYSFLNWLLLKIEKDIKLLQELSPEKNEKRKMFRQVRPTSYLGDLIKSILMKNQSYPLHSSLHLTVLFSIKTSKFLQDFLITIKVRFYS